MTLNHSPKMKMKVKMKVKMTAKKEAIRRSLITAAMIAALRQKSQEENRTLTCSKQWIRNSEPWSKNCEASFQDVLFRNE